MVKIRVLQRVLVTGNTKFDALAGLTEAPEDLALRTALNVPVGARVWIAGSTHEGEDPLRLVLFPHQEQVDVGQRIADEPEEQTVTPHGGG